MNTAVDECPPYCDCEFPENSDVIARIECRCGEDDMHALDWQWEPAMVDNTTIEGRNVTFHTCYSTGTGLVRGSKPLEANAIHFWEIRTLTVLFGTDVMFGIGTTNIDANILKSHFCSALGFDGESWGLSYSGKIQHNGKRLNYGRKFSQGCIVGVCLDRSRGTLEYFLNRRSLGVAFTNIPTDPNVQLYPMASSTAAKSAIRLINCTSQPECLQLHTYRKIITHQPWALKQLRQMPGLRSVMQAYWFLMPPVRYSQHSHDDRQDIADEAVLPAKVLLKRKQHFKDEDIDLNDLYSNAPKIRHNDDNEELKSRDDDEYLDKF